MNELLSDVFDNISESGFRELLRGGSLDFTLLNDPRDAVKVAAHCCLNGPVGVNKITSFPDSLTVKVKDLYNGRLSNKMWKNFCIEVAKMLKDRFPQITEECQQTHLNGDVWPLNEEGSD